MSLLSEFDPAQGDVDSILQKRKEREYQRRHRGDKRSASDLYENASILLAWQAAELTEGQAARALGISRVELRELNLITTALGRSLAYNLI